jgi:hypothetical protein
MKLNKIEWHFLNPPPQLECISCKKPAVYMAEVDIETDRGRMACNLCLCESCTAKTEGELLKSVFGGAK